MSANTTVMDRMILEIVSGWEWGDPRSQVPQTDENRETWDSLAADIARIIAVGGLVHIPPS